MEFSRRMQGNVLFSTFECTKFSIQNNIIYDHLCWLIPGDKW